MVLRKHDCTEVQGEAVHIDTATAPSFPLPGACLSFALQEFVFLTANAPEKRL